MKTLKKHPWSLRTDTEKQLLKTPMLLPWTQAGDEQSLCTCTGALLAYQFEEASCRLWSCMMRDSFYTCTLRDGIVSHEYQAVFLRGGVTESLLLQLGLRLHVVCLLASPSLRHSLVCLHSSVSTHDSAERQPRDLMKSAGFWAVT